MACIEKSHLDAPRCETFAHRDRLLRVSWRVDFSGGCFMVAQQEPSFRVRLELTIHRLTDDWGDSSPWPACDCFWRRVRLRLRFNPNYNLAGLDQHPAYIGAITDNRDGTVFKT